MQLFKTKVLIPRAQVTIADFGYPVQALWFYCSQIQAIQFRPFGFIAPRFWLSCLDPFAFLFPDFGYPVQALQFYCSQILAIQFRPFSFIAPKCFDIYLAVQSFDCELLLNEGYSRNRPCDLNLMSTFLLHQPLLTNSLLEPVFGGPFQAKIF